MGVVHCYLVKSMVAGVLHSVPLKTNYRIKQHFWENSIDSRTDHMKSGIAVVLLKPTLLQQTKRRERSSRRAYINAAKLVYGSLSWFCSFGDENKTRFSRWGVSVVWRTAR